MQDVQQHAGSEKNQFKIGNPQLKIEKNETFCQNKNRKNRGINTTMMDKDSLPTTRQLSQSTALVHQQRYMYLNVHMTMQRF